MNNPSAQRLTHKRVGWSILALLLLLRIPFTIAIIYLLPIENQKGGAIYEVSTYLLTCFLIWWEREHLTEFHIDKSALFILLLFRPIQTLILQTWGVDSPVAFPRFMGVVQWMIALGLLIALWRSGFQSARFTPQALGWLTFGILTGVCLSLSENFQVFVSMLSNISSAHGDLTPLLTSTGLNLFYHLGFAPVSEEPLFRGFLWGYLRQLNWKESLIWIFQAVLFTSAHIYFAAQFPIRFWVFIPIAGLLFGWLTWRSRSIAPAMLAHAMVNGSVYLFIIVLIRYILS